MPGKEIDTGKETAKERKVERAAQRETGTRADVQLDGRHPHMRGPHHEHGEYHDGKHHHDHHRGKKD